MKEKYFVLLVCVMLCYFLSSPTRAQDSASLSMSTQGSINYPSPNLAITPDDFEPYDGVTVRYGNDPQICFVDWSVVRTAGKPSIRLEPHTAADTNYARELDGRWLPVNVGDHVVAKCWMKVQTGPSTSGYPQCGARLGMDFFGYVNGVYSMLPDGDAFNNWQGFWYDYYGGDYSKGYVQDSNGGAWQQRTIDIITPAQLRNTSGVYGNVTSVVIWLQGSPWTANDSTASTVWFADAELYINPT